jgi:hypothetical protein
MAGPPPKPFLGLPLQRGPLINVRLEFNELLGLFRNRLFREQFRGYKGRRIPVRTHYFTWHGRPRVLLSYLLRDAIVGLESAVSGGVWNLAVERKLLTETVREATLNPLSLKEFRGTAACVYRGLPALIDPALALDQQTPALWRDVVDLYREVRNPLFHAFEVATDDPDPVLACFELIWQVYQWLNGWYPITNLLAGPIQWAQDFPRRLTEIPEVSDVRVNQIVPPRSLPAAYRTNDRYLPADCDLISIESVDGVHVPPSELIQVSMTAESGRHVQVELSPNSAVRLLAFLALAREGRGWELPDRL